MPSLDCESGNNQKDLDQNANQQNRYQFNAQGVSSVDMEDKKHGTDPARDGELSSDGNADKALPSPQDHISKEHPQRQGRDIVEPAENIHPPKLESQGQAEGGRTDKTDGDLIPPLCANTPRTESPTRHNDDKEATDHKAAKPKHRKRSAFEAKYKMGSEIGRGSFATVYKGEHVPSHTPVAIKSVDRRKLNQKLIENLEAEIRILRTMSHPHIVGLLDHATTESYFVLVMEYCALGDLSQFIRLHRHQTNKDIAPAISRIFKTYYSPSDAGLDERITRHFLHQLVRALKFLRERNLVHRDIKPQNLLLCPPSNEGESDLPTLKLADFGFARFLPSTSLAETLCGSPLYMAPEILRYEKYNAKADLWSVGTVLYEMAVGTPPFKAANHVELLHNIEQGNDRIHFPERANVSRDMKNLIKALLRNLPTERIGFQEFFANALCDETSTNAAPTNSATSDLLPDSTYNGVQQIARITTTTTTTNTDTKIASAKAVSSQPPTNDNVNNRYRRYESTQNNLANLGSVTASISPNQAVSNPTHSRPTSLEEQEYVVVEKRTVQVNALADELASSPAVKAAAAAAVANKSQTSHTTHTGGAVTPINLVRRRSSVNYGTSPKNALSKALNLVGARMRGSTPPQQLKSPVDSEARLLVIQLESLATKAKVVALFAQVKFTQICDELENTGTAVNREPELMSNNINDNAEPGSRAMVGSNGSGSDYDSSNSGLQYKNTGLSPEATRLVAEEALVLYVKVLSLLAKAMNLASAWWKAHDSACVTYEMNETVQWIRSKFNECLARAEDIQTILDSQNLSGVSGNKLIFDRALEMARAAAVSELVGTDLEGCAESYSTALWMLEAVLDQADDDEHLDAENRAVVDKFIASISHRLNVMRNRLTS